MKRFAVPLLLVFSAGAVIACPDARQDADAKPAYLDKMATTAPQQMSKAPAAKPAATKLAVKPGSAKTAAAETTKKPSGG
jgi:hypothetical protein